MYVAFSFLYMTLAVIKWMDMVLRNNTVHHACLAKKAKLTL